MEDPKTYPDYASAEPALMRGEVVAIPIGASLSESTPKLTEEQEQVINLFYSDLLAKMTHETAIKKLRGIWSANREVLKNDDLAWLAMIADWLQAQQEKIEFQRAGVRGTIIGALAGGHMNAPDGGAWSKAVLANIADMMDLEVPEEIKKANGLHW